MKINNLIADKLRKSILQLAIQGKLVKQNPDDEPASELVKKIYAEKQKLIAEGKIKKDKTESYIYKGDDNRYYEKIGKNEPVDITDDLPFDIPDSWEWIRLFNISDISAGGTPDRATPQYWQNGTIPWLKISDITSSNKYVKKATEYITEEGIDKSSAKIFSKGTILYTIFATIGEIGILDFEASTNQAIAGIDTFYKNIDDYLYYYLKNLQDFMKSLSKGCAQFNINQKILKEALIPLPPLAEQQRIVEKIESMEPYLAQYDKIEKQLTKLESEIKDKLKKSILQYAIQGKLVKQDPNDEPASVLLERIKAEKEQLIKEGKIKRDKNESFIYKGDYKNYYEKNSQKTRILNGYVFDLPQNWEWCSLSNLSKLITDGTHKTPNYVSQGIPFLSVQNISSGKFDLSKLKYISEDEHLILTKRCNPNINDILICRIGTLGKPIINTLDFDFSIFVSLGLVKLINSQLVDYIKFVLDSPFIYNFIDYVKVGGGTHTYKINIEDMSRFPIPLAPIEEQKRILKKYTIFENIIK